MSEEYRILDVNDHVSFKKKIEAINWCTEKDYDKNIAWQQACWPSNRPKSYDFRIWFPRLAPKKNGEYIPATNDCVNYLSEDWNYFFFDDLRKDRKSAEPADRYLGLDLIFAKDVDGDYIFRGVYMIDLNKSKPNHFLYKRIATKIKLIGKPVERFEILDSIEAVTVDDINTPMKPKDTIRKADGDINYICGRCNKAFICAARCPECGQMVKE